MNLSIAPHHTKADVLELVADFIRDGVPEPVNISIYQPQPSVLVRIDEIAEWCTALEVCLPDWASNEDFPDRLFAVWPDGTWDGKAIRLEANCPTPAEVTC